MVSVRRKKTKKSFVGEKRRSARLLALDVVGSSNLGTNTEDAYDTREIGETSNGICARNSSISKIVQHVLDVLELKDTHELFTMPDSMQIDDYTERVKSPSDFATLRQKNIDGMYTNLEQFESDVYTVFKKAITINDHNTFPYKQAIYLQDQAKQVLQSLNTNRANSKLDTGQHNHVRGRKKPKQNDETAPASSRPSLLSEKPENVEVGVTEKKSDVCWSRKYLRTAQPKSTPNFQTREEPHAVEPILTYMADKDLQFGITSSTFGNQKPHLVLNTPNPAYMESLWSFTKNGGTEAQNTAKERCQACNEKAKVPIFPQPQFGDYSYGLYYDSTTLAQFIPQQMYNRNCKLETDELLRCFESIGTPKFVEKVVQLKTNDDYQAISQKHILDFPKNNLSQKEIDAPVKNTMTRLEHSEKDVKVVKASSSCNGVVSSQLGFSQYASLLKPFQPDV